MEMNDQVTKDDETNNNHSKEDDRKLVNTYQNNTTRKRGNVPSKFKTRKKLLQQREDLVDDFHIQLEGDNGESPLILLELGKKEWKRLQPNSIYVSDARIYLPEKAHCTKKKIYYNTIEYGKNLTCTKNNITSKELIMKDESNSIVCDVVNIQDVKKSVLAIVTDKQEVLKLYSNFISISSNATPGSPKNSLFKGSNKVLLCLMKHERLKSPDNECHWNSKLFQKLQRTKPNICVKNGVNNHFNSQGYISAWGNKAFYGKSTLNSTVSQYVTKTSMKASRIEEVSKENADIENIVSKEVKVSVERLSKYFPNIRELIAPILNVAYVKQIDDGDINFNLSKTSKDGLWQSELCVNAITRDFHTEKDVTYTLISVPQQDCIDKSKKKPSPTMFLFKINEDKTVGFKMSQNISFIFNGTMLTHRQFCEDGYEKESIKGKVSDFYNIACYGNQRLFNHLRHSFRRELGLEE